MILGRDDNIFIRSLFHEYDPVKAHEYYERTKHLKGRKKGMAIPTPSETRSRNQTPSGPFKGKRPKQPESSKAETIARIAVYKERLAALKEVLAKLVKLAKLRNSENAGTEESRAKESKDSSSTDSTSSKKSGSSTAKEKADAKKYYEKNKDKISLKKQEANLKNEIKDVQKKIADVKAELQNSVKNSDGSKTKQTNNKQRNKTVVSQ